MYKSYFGFSVAPFENNLDQRFLFFSSNHKEVSAALLYFIKLKKGFALVCGDVGTGKTMLINYLLNKLPDSVHPIMIMNPDVGYFEILRYVAGILKIDVKGIRVLELVDHVKAALIEASRQGKRFVLIIDEAHLLSDKSIEQIRLLSNIETQEHKLFQILLLGQYELSYKLNRPELRQLRQRININRFLAPMDAVETIQYIDHRLKMAGSSFDACFESDCKDLLFKMTNGVPRSINQLCDSALLACMTEKRKKVTRKILKTAAAVLRSDVLYTPRSHAGRRGPTWKSIGPLAGFAAAALIVILLVIAGFRGALGEKTRTLLHPGLTPPSPVQGALPGSAPHPEPSPDPNRVSVQKVPQNKEIFGDSGTVLPERRQSLQPETPDLPVKDPGNVDIASSPPSAVKNIPAENRSSSLPDALTIVVKNGDTLMGIASQYFPENKADGLKKILAVNPVIDNIDRIYTGQELIIPETGSLRKDPN